MPDTLRVEIEASIRAYCQSAVNAFAQELASNGSTENDIVDSAIGSLKDRGIGGLGDVLRDRMAKAFSDSLPAVSTAQTAASTALNTRLSAD